MEIKVRAISKEDIRLGKPMMFHQAIIDGEPFFVHDDIRYPYAGVMFDDDFIKMLSTGLHDCHGKEIWEGDKLQYKMDSAGEYVKQVEFKDGSFGFYQHTDYFRNFSDVDLSKYQVIGNIWEE